MQNTRKREKKPQGLVDFPRMLFIIYMDVGSQQDPVHI
jgi:hypothetical protein